MIQQSTLRWSVVIPAYMPGENLAVAVDSVLVAMGTRQDYEVVVVDDGSPDPITLREYGPRVRLDTCAENVGAVPNFNRAIGRAEGEFIHVLHADDYVEPGFYGALEAGLAIDGVVAAACGVHRVDGAGVLIETMKPELPRAGIWTRAFERLAVSNRLPAPSVVAKRSTYDQVGVFDESLIHAADWDLWIRFSQAGPIYYDPEPLAAYRVHDAQHTASLAQSGKNIDDAIAVIRRLPARVGRRDGTPLMTRALLYRSVYAARMGGRALRTGQWRAAGVQARSSARCVLLSMQAFGRGVARR